MSRIDGINGNIGPQRIQGQPPSQQDLPQEPAAYQPNQDEVEISELARLLGQAQLLPEIRADKVESIKAQIADGTYDTEDKMDRAIDMLLEDLDSII